MISILKNSIISSSHHKFILFNLGYSRGNATLSSNIFKSKKRFTVLFKIRKETLTTDNIKDKQNDVTHSTVVNKDKIILDNTKPILNKEKSSLLNQEPKKPLVDIILKNTTTETPAPKSIKIDPLPPPQEKDLKTEQLKEKIIKGAVHKRLRVDLTASSFERNFITPIRAMSDFLLKPFHLEDLRKTQRRSPYENEPPITVYWRKDVEQRALEVWGSKENLVKELLMRDAEKKLRQQDIFNLKRTMRNYRRSVNFMKKNSELFGSSGRVVLAAVVINGGNFFFKLLTWLYTGSHSMFSECIHSLADTINQLILVYGIHKSTQQANPDHPYGYSNMKYVASLISGVGIFCVGAGLSVYHGISGLVHPNEIDSLFWGFITLFGSLASEGATLYFAFNSIRRGARESKVDFLQYLYRGSDPSVTVVFFEDLAAVAGVLVAASCMSLTVFTGSHIPDAVGSIIVGGLLGAVASFIIYTNVAALVGRSITEDRLRKINWDLESDVMIRAIHDVKGIDIGNSLVRYKAEVDFDGRELTRAYLDSQDLQALLEEVNQMKSIDQFETFFLLHGERIVDRLGGEIDRIETKLKKRHPEIRHCDLEIL